MKDRLLRKLSGNSKALRESAESIASLLFAAVVQFASFLALARMLGAKDYAIIVGVASVVTVSVEFIGLGCGDVIVKTRTLDSERYRYALGSSITIILFTFPMVFCIDYFILGFFFPNTHGYFSITMCLLFSELYSARFLALSEQIGIAHQDYRSSNTVRISPQVFRALVIFVSYTLGVKNISSWWSIQFFIGIVPPSLAFLYMISLHGRPSFHKLEIDWKVQLSFAATQQLRSLQTNVDRFAAGLIMSPSALGAYGVAARLVNYSLLPLQALLRINYPKFFEQGAVGGLSATSKFAARLVAPYTLIALFSAFGIILVASNVEIFLGGTFAEAAHFMLILSPLPIIMALQFPNADALSGAGFQWLRTRGIFVGVIFICLLTVLGAIYAGASGVAVGVLLGNLILAFYYKILVKRGI